MNSKLGRPALIAAALAGLAAAPITAAHAEEKVQCYGIAKAGQNDCASKTGDIAAPAKRRSTTIRAT